jgi:glycosyltransferase involved in cell wall biosynthesis
MRIAVLTSLYPGPPRPHEGIFAERRWLAMSARGHDVRVVQPLPRTPGPLARGAWAELAEMPAREVRGGIPVERPRYLHLPRFPRRNARQFARAGVRRVLAGERPDVVVLDYAWPAVAAIPALGDAGLACVVNGRGSDVLQVAGEAGLGADLAGYLREAAGWCAVSLDLVRALDELGGRPGAGVLVPNGVDVERFTPRSRESARAELGRAGEGTLVLVVGHLIERKDPLLALEAFAAADLGPGARLAFVGRGPLAGAVEARAGELGLAHAVELVGEESPERLAAWYAACDAMVLTSRREGRPNVVLECLASGRPVLATAAGGTGELLEGLEGMLSTSRAPDVLGRMLASLLERDHDAAELVARVAPLSWEASCTALEGALEAAVTRVR